MSVIYLEVDPDLWSILLGLRVRKPRLEKLSQALQGTGQRGAKPDDLAVVTGIPLDETKQLLTILQRDRLAFATPGDIWRRSA